ncbi:hypothetical protein [Paenibacillus polymyxa]|uniref:hypothetical protein n=1 Tax=Paenibacillus polymyxa TaxID=1406 RepID=UPI00058A0658|nr:hypothetical protein [Paenibacillus polymyxa]AJE51949.1 hypothetical protein RE92_13285 [Paenibacillus polymyxa]QOH64236.1 hypothetical protein DI243_23785 [Paenibacillus polymyxa]
MIQQDKRITEYMFPVEIHRGQLREWAEGSLYTDEESVLQCYVSGDADYIDFIEQPVAIVSEQLKEIFDIYQAGLSWRLIVFADMQRMQQTRYWLAHPPSLMCLSPLTEYHRDGTLKKIILDEYAVENHKIFRVQHANQHIIVDLDVAECILKFNLAGLKLQKVDTERPSI